MPSNSWGIGPSLAYLRAWLGAGGTTKVNPDELPQVSQTPDWWASEPFVTGGQDLANEVYAFNKKYPRAKKWVSSVTMGPTSASIDEMIRSKLKPGQFQGTNLLGVYSNPRRGGDASIGLNP